MDQRVLPKAGDDVRLVEKPDGYCSQHYNLTVGNIYKVMDIFGCCVVTNTDGNDTGSYHRDRVVVVSRQP